MRYVFLKLYTAWVLIVFTVSMLILLPGLIIPFLFGNRFSWLGYRFLALWSWIFSKLTFIPYRIHGREKIIRGKAYIFVSNHTSFLDIPGITLTIPGEFRPLAKKELLKIPVFGFIAKGASVIVDRSSGESRKKSFDQLKRTLAEGISLLIFAEGTQNRTKEPLQPFKDGAFRIAIDTEQTILPLVVLGAGPLFPPSSLTMKPGTIKTTFLGAHAVPKETTKPDYIRLVIDEMIPAVAEEKLADYIDVFCEDGFFAADETERIVEAGKRFGMRPRIHANQLNRSGGVQVGVKTHAISVDHLENIGDEEIDVLKNSGVMPTALPGAAFFLGLPSPPARKIIQSGLPLAIASDYNPGSAPSGNMMLMVALACIRMKMTPEEAFNAATINTAYALELSVTHGSITKGKVANVFITKPISSVAFLPYAFGSQMIDSIILNGEIQK